MIIWEVQKVLDCEVRKSHNGTIIWQKLWGWHWWENSHGSKFPKICPVNGGFDSSWFLYVMHFISWLLSLWGTPLFPKYLLSLISVRLGKSNFFALDIFFSFARTLYRTTFQIFLLMIYHKEFMFVILNYLTFYVIFKVMIKPF